MTPHEKKMICFLVCFGYCADEVERQTSNSLVALWLCLAFMSLFYLARALYAFIRDKW